MKTQDEIMWLKNKTGTPVAVALGIQGEVVHTFVTYEWFFDLLKRGLDVRSTNDDYSFVEFFDGDTWVESLECSEMLGAILLSSPDVIEITRGSNNPNNKNRYVHLGWTYDENLEFITPEGFEPPSTENANSLSKSLRDEILNGKQ
jgi:hypothetical protein